MGYVTLITSINFSDGLSGRLNQIIDDQAADQIVIVHLCLLRKYDRRCSVKIGWFATVPMIHLSDTNGQWRQREFKVGGRAL